MEKENNKTCVNDFSMIKQFDTDFEYDEWFEKKQGNKIIKNYWE